MSLIICCFVMVVVEEYGFLEFFRQFKEFVDVLKSYGVLSFFLEFFGVDYFDIIENMMNFEDYLCKEILKVVQEEEGKRKKVEKLLNSGF